jgi:hypothetical protein
MSDSWKTGVSGDWSQAGNWTGGVPGEESSVTVAVVGDYTVTIAGTESFAAGSVTLDNEKATLELAGNLELFGSSSTLAAGLLDLTGSLFELGSFTLVAGSFDLAGTLGGQGSLELDGGTLALKGGEINFPTVSLAGADFVLQSDLDYGGSFLESAGILDLNGFNATMSGIAELGTGGYSIGSDYVTTFAMISGPGSLDITNFAAVNNIYLSDGAVLQDNGIIVDAGYLYFGGYADGFYGSPDESASMSISSGAVFDFIASSMPEEYDQFPITYFAGSASSIVNAGLFEMIATGSNPILPFFTNLSTGTIYAAAGADLQFTGGGVLGGKLIGPGEVDFTGGTYSLVTGLAINAAHFAIAGEDFEIPLLKVNGSATLAGNGHLGEGAASADFSGADATIIGHGVLDVTGTVDIDSVDLTGGLALKDNGAITLDGNLDLGDDSPATTDTGSDAALLSIASGGVFDIVAGGTINDFDVINGAPLAASIVNTGLFELTAGTSENEVDGPFTNDGTVAAYASTLLLAGITDGAAGTLRGGVWDVKSTRPAGSTLALQTPLTINTDDAQISLSRSGSELLSGPGEGTAIEQSLTSIASDGVLSLLDARGFTATAKLIDAGTIALQNGVFTAPALAIAAGGIFDLHDAIFAAPTLEVAGGGIFGGYGTLRGAVDNDGLIKATDAALTITGDVSGTGSLGIDSRSELLLEAGVSRGTDITFGHTLSILDLDAPHSFSGTLVSFQPSDTIELIGIASITSEHFSDGVLTLTDGAGSIALTFANPAVFSSGLAVNSAGGNTSITEALPAAVTHIAIQDAASPAKDVADDQTAPPAIGVVDPMMGAIPLELAFLRPAATEFAGGRTKTVRQSTALDALFGRQLPTDVFSRQRCDVNANILQQIVPDEPAPNFAADLSEPITSMTHAHSLITLYMKHD